MAPVVYGTVGELSAKEQAAAIRALAARPSYLDRSRVAIWGWSGGGRHLERDVPLSRRYGPVSRFAVPDQRLYDTIYQERYMGLPDENKAGGFRRLADHFAEGLKGALLSCTARATTTSTTRARSA